MSLYKIDVGYTSGEVNTDSSNIITSTPGSLEGWIGKHINDMVKYFQKTKKMLKIIKVN